MQNLASKLSTVPAALFAAGLSLALCGPAAAEPPGVKPHYVKCDPAHPERPCTPDGPVPGPPRAAGSEGRPTDEPDCIKMDLSGEQTAQASPVPMNRRPGPAKPHADTADKPGRKPMYVKCDPAQPHMPCTPDLAQLPGGIERTPAPPEKPGVKPMYVKCDPARPNMPCTPDGPIRAPEGLGAQGEAGSADPRLVEPSPSETPPGVKPHYVKCDPAHPEMPCTPDPVAPRPPPGPPPPQSDPTDDDADADEG